MNEERLKKMFLKSRQRGRMVITIDMETYEILQRLREKYYLSFPRIVRLLALEGEKDFENIQKKYEDTADQERV
jgi:hypothetical protein